MLGLQHRDQFKGSKPNGMTIDLSHAKARGVLKRTAPDFLGVTQPTMDPLDGRERTTGGDKACGAALRRRTGQIGPHSCALPSERQGGGKGLKKGGAIAEEVR